MRNKLLIASFVGLVVCFSCKKQTTDPVLPEQKVFENLPSSLCCTTCNTPVSRYNLTGTVVSRNTDNAGKDLYYDIVPDQDQRASIPDSVLPLFKYYGTSFYICNMPDKIVNSNRQRKVRFDCKFFYYRFPAYVDTTGGRFPQSSAYMTQLIRIELID